MEFFANAKARAEAQRLANERTRMDLEDRKRADASWAGAADILAPKSQAAADDQQPGLVQLSGPGAEDGPARVGGGMPDAPGAPGLEPATPAGPDTPEHRIGYALYQNPALAQDPGIDQQMRTYFAKNKNEVGLKWWETVKTAQKENLFNALHSAMGGDLDRATQEFNGSGEYKIEPGSLQWADEKHTKLTGRTADGKDFTMDPQQTMQKLLSPKEYFAEQETQRKRSIEEQRAKSEENLRSAQADYYRGAKSALDRAKADKLGGVDDKTMNNVVAKAGLALRAQMEHEQSKEDAKFNVNGMVTLLPDMQKEVGSAIRNGTDPEVALATTYNTYRDRVAGLNDALAQIVAASNKPWTSAGKKEELTAGMSKFLQEFNLTPDDVKKYLPATKVGKADAERVRTVLGEMKVKGSVNAAPGKVEEPKTMEEFQKLPTGTKYINPRDGKTYTKK